MLKKYYIGSIGFFLFINLFTILLFLFIYTNIPFLRIVIGFIYLTFVPGLIIIRLFKIYKKVNIIEIIFLTVGISISFLAIFSLLFNNVILIIGLSKPFFINTFIIAFIIVIELVTLMSLRLNKEKIEISLEHIKNINMYVFSIIYLLLPIITAFYFMPSNDNYYRLFIIAFIAILFIIPSISPTLNNEKFHSLALYSLSLSLILHSTLVSNYIYGGDIHMEYQIFRITQNNLMWNPNIETVNMGYHWLNAMIIISMIPTIYSNILNVNGMIIYKIIIPILFSLVSIILYKIYQKEFNNKIAYYSVLFFIANSVFYSDVTYGNVRQMMAELFYILIIYILIIKKFTSFNKSIFFIIFSISLIFSHYSLSYYLLFILFGIIISKYLLKYNISFKDTYVLQFFTLMFLWYIYIPNSGPFKGLVSTIDWLWRSFLTQFLDVQSRGEMVLTGLGLAGMSTI